MVATMLLEGRVAVIYGAGGAIGGAVAAAFAAAGAQVALAGRTRAPLEAVAARIEAAGGKAQIAIVDALDGDAVEAHLAAILASAGRIDISFNLVGMGDTHGAALIDMAPARFVTPIATV